MFFSCHSAFDTDAADYLSGMTNQKGENKMSLRIIYAAALGLSVMSSGLAFAQAGNSGTTGMTGGGGPRNTTGTMNGTGTQYNGNAGDQGSGTTGANPPSGTSNEDTPIGSPGGSTTGTSDTGSASTGSGNVGGSIGGK
jgi:hypothetical protein